MVSKGLALIGLASLLAAQEPQTVSHLNEKDSLKTPAVLEEKAKPLLSPEMKGDIFMARKMYRDAVDAYREGGDTPVLYNKIGIAYHQMLDLSNAKKWYEKSIRLDKKYPEAINNLGTVHYAQKSYRRAIGYYRRALRLTPDSASIHSNLGTAYFARKKYKEASQEYETALKLDPEVFEHRSTQGVLLQERSVEERAKFHFYLAKTYAKSGAADRALLYMRKALEEGFKEKEKFREDADFASIRELPEFEELLARETKIL